uniref:CHK kinase-like domain-containing protein n=1 Tax=Acrobeloides nanus TaxID=290746 RepID=A0A914C114_9BILA
MVDTGRRLAEAIGEDFESVRFAAEHKLAVTLPGLRTLKMEGDGKEYTAYLTEEEVPGAEEEEPSLEYLASLAGFYNARYAFEKIKFEKIRIPVGQFRAFVRIQEGRINRNVVATIIEDPTEKHHLTNGDTNGHIKSDPLTLTIEQAYQVAEAFSQLHANCLPETNPTEKHHLTNGDTNGHIKSDPLTLTIEQAYQVAEAFSQLHANCLPETNNEIRETVDENYTLISKFLSENFYENVNYFLETLLEKHGNFFKNTDGTFEKFSALYKDTESLQSAMPDTGILPKVLCHGNLCMENLEFDSKGNLISIKNWENVHYGSVAEDLAFLMITSLPAKQRRNNYLKIFRHYFYTLVDIRSLKFKLSDLKAFYKVFFKYAIFFSMSALTNLVNSADFSHDVKSAAVARWEEAVNEAYDLETGAFISDDESPLTAQNS